MNNMKLLKLGNEYQVENQKKVIDFLVNTQDAVREPKQQDYIIRTTKGRYIVSVCAVMSEASAREPSENNYYGRKYMELFCDGIKIVRQFKDGRIAIYTISTKKWLKIVQEKMVRGLSVVEWPEIKQLCSESPIVAMPSTECLISADVNYVYCSP